MARLVDIHEHGARPGPGIAVVWPDEDPPDDWSRRTGCPGREQHLVRPHLDAGRVGGVPEEDRRALLLPAVLEALERLVTKLELSLPPEDLPGGVLRQSRAVSSS